jgi:hypothetical protein
VSSAVLFHHLSFFHSCTASATRFERRRSVLPSGGDQGSTPSDGDGEGVRRQGSHKVT